MLILLFNLYGYRLLFTSLQTKAYSILETKIDNQEYNDAELIEIRIALNMPYQERYTEFERHYGEVKIDGKVYSYVKRKIEGDILVLQCIPNHSKQHLKEKADELAKANSGQERETTGKNQLASYAKTFSGDYYNNDQFGLVTGQYLYINKHNPYYLTALCDAHLQIPHQPPRC